MGRESAFDDVHALSLWPKSALVRFAKTFLVILASMAMTALFNIMPTGNASAAPKLGDAWTQGTTASQAVGGASTAYDPMTKAVYAYGGKTTGGYSPTTSKWSGTSWSNMSLTTTAQARSTASMIYDTHTGKIILFGGKNATGTLTSTYSFNGTTWIRLTPTLSPTARYGSSFAYDQATGNAILFGGAFNTTTYYGDTWSWNGSTWTKLTPTNSPPARAYAQMAYDPNTGDIILFGGQSNVTGNLDDTWAWNGSTWTKLSPAQSPSARNGGSMVYDPDSKALVMVAGITGAGSTAKLLTTTWEWTGAWNKLATSSFPTAETNGAMAYDTTVGDALLYDGYINSTTYSTYSKTVWFFQPAAPTKVTSVPTVVVGKTRTATVKWTPVATDGSAVPVSYVVTSTPTALTCTSAPTATTCTFKNLKIKTQYSFTVNAKNNVGENPTSSPSSAKSATILGLPGEPTSLNATTGPSNTALLRWNLPTTTGSTAINGWVISSSPPLIPTGTCPFSNSTLTCTFRGLNYGVPYTFKVAAKSSDGTGPSAVSNEILVIRSPTPPRSVQAIPGTAQAKVSWVAPATDGGAPVVSYRVLSSTTAHDCIVTAPATSCVVTGLRNASHDTFYVIATNKNPLTGKSFTSTHSETSSEVTPYTKTGLASDVKALAENESAKVSWKGPTGYSKDVLETYDVKSNTNTKSCSAKEPKTAKAQKATISCTVKGLKNGTIYTFSVTPELLHGPHPTSAPSNPVSPGPGLGYWLVGSNGQVYSFGDAHALGYVRHTAKKVVGIAGTNGAGGYFEVYANGALVSFGNAHRSGTASSKREHIQAVVLTPGGTGYWEVTTSGAVYNFGHAKKLGSVPNDHPRGYVVALDPTPKGTGYWIVTTRGVVYAFGTAKSYGTMAKRPPKSPIIAAVAMATGLGYWLVGENGSVSAFGRAHSFGTASHKRLGSPVVGMAALPSSTGYWLVTKTGEVLSYGKAKSHGNLVGKKVTDIVGIAGS